MTSVTRGIFKIKFLEKKIRLKKISIKKILRLKIKMTNVTPEVFKQAIASIQIYIKIKIYKRKALIV